LAKRVGDTNVRRQTLPHGFEGTDACPKERSVLTRLVILGTCLTLPVASVAQEPDSLPLASRLEVFHEYLGFASYLDGGQITPRWMADGDRFWYEVPDGEGGGYRLVDPSSGRVSELFDEERLRHALEDVTGEPVKGEGLPFTEFGFSASDTDLVTFTVDSSQYELDLADYSIREASPAEEPGPRPRQVAHYSGMPMYMPEALSPDGRWFAGLEGGNITLRSTETESVVPLTANGSDDHPWGASDWGLGLYWSADSRRLLATRLQRPIEQRWPHIRYPFVGEGPRRASPGGIDWRPVWELRGNDLYLIDVESGEQTKLEFPTPEGQSILEVERIPDGSGFLVKRQTLRGETMELHVVDPRNGSYRTLLSESAPRGYVYAPNEPMYWEFLEDGRRFVLRSERDGWQHLYLFDVRDGLIRQLTQGPFPIRNSVIDEDNGWVYFPIHNVDLGRPWDRHVGRVPLEGGDMEILTSEPGQHRFALSPSGRFFLDEHASEDRPVRADLRRSDGSLVMTVSQGSVARARAELSWSPPDPFIATASDGQTLLHGTLFKPWDFDPDRRYPVVDFVWAMHGLGAVSLRRDAVSPPFFAAQAMAQLGFVVISFDDRGTYWRGRDFRLSTWGRGETDQPADHRAVLEQLASERPWMDLGRVGVIGHSTFGFRAARMMLLQSDLYDVGVASAVADFPTTAQDTYWHEISGFDEMPFVPNSELAANLSGRIMLALGTDDFQGKLRDMVPLMDALVQARKQYDILLIPGANHGMFFPGMPYSEYFWDMVARYFVEHLGGPAPRR
jgi:dipeptidyl aminopeptidase/acylaminoacyl peptidase